MKVANGLQSTCISISYAGGGSEQTSHYEHKGVKITAKPGIIILNNKSLSFEK